MSKRIVLMKQKIRQAELAGHSKDVVLPKNCKRKSLISLFEKTTK